MPCWMKHLHGCSAPEVCFCSIVAACVDAGAAGRARGQAGGVSDSDAAVAIGGQLSWLPTNTGHMRKHRKTR